MCRAVVVLCVGFFFFFFKQKTAYEMRISDWSSDVCSSDLEQAACLSGIGRAIYDALLERIVVEHDGRKDPARHRLHLDGMVRDYGGRAVELDLAGLQTDIGIMPARLLSVLEATKTWLAQGGRDPSRLYDVFQAAEERKRSEEHQLELPA